MGTPNAAFISHQYLIHENTDREFPLQTVFYPEVGPAKKFSGKGPEGTSHISVELEVGMALLHKHGQDCLLHEGRKVIKGEKWVIRSDLCVKR